MGRVTKQGKKVARERSEAGSHRVQHRRVCISIQGNQEEDREHKQLANGEGRRMMERWVASPYSSVLLISKIIA